MDSWRLADPWWLLLLIPVLVLVWWPRRRAGVAFGPASMVGLGIATQSRSVVV